MRIQIIHPDYGLTPEQIQTRVNRLNNVVGGDVEITMTCVTKTRVCIDSALDASIAVPEVVSLAMRAEQQGYDAVGIYCLSDPGYDACREAVSIPVLGGGHCAFSMAMLMGYTTSMITTSGRRIPQKVEFVRSCGVDFHRLASVRQIEYDIAAHRDGGCREEVIQQLARVAQECVDRDGADTVILGCLSFAGMGHEIEKLVGVPIIDPAYALVTCCEAVVRQRLRHSKKSYPTPPAAQRSWSAGEICFS